MRKLIGVTLAVMIAVSAGLLALGAVQAEAKEPKILEFDTMVGVPRPYTGGANAIRGVSGGGLPWVIGAAHGELKQSGKLEIQVTGLVFDPNDPVVAERGLANSNTIPAFRAIVSCLTTDGTTASTVNIQTEPFPATLGLASQGGGNAKIEAHLALPQPCIAPIVFVTSPTGAWFAATGY